MTFAPFPKPAPKEKVRKPLQRTPMHARKSPYLHPEWRKLAAAVRRRSKGVCEGCGAAPGDDVHHRAYGPKGTWRKLMVPLDQLIHLCRRCHLDAHRKVA